MVNVLVAGAPVGLQVDDPDGLWITRKHRELLDAVSPGVVVEHLSARELNQGATPIRPPHAILIETSGNDRVDERLPGMVLRGGFERLFSDKLRFVQTCAVGVENLIPLIPASVTLANAAGVHANAIAESVACAILSDAKRFDERRSRQAAHEWQTLRCRELTGATHCIIGVGHIGSAVARLSKALGMSTIGVARTQRELENFDFVHPVAHLGEALRFAEYVTVACPLTPQTRNLITATEFDAMWQRPYFVNVARGAVVDESALVEAVRSDKISGAFLDAFVLEPLPKTHVLWSVPSVRISPHDSASSQHVSDNQISLFADNLSRFVSGRPLRNVVNFALGY